MHNGAVPHFLLAVREFFNNEFPEKWMERRGPNPWHARSPALYPSHFYVGVI
jgi:hypothetical protein